jgi:hypothetical protein
MRGSRDTPFEVTSAAVVEARTSLLDCAHCHVGTYRIGEHVAHLPQSPRLRRVDVACRNCGSARSLFFRLVPDRYAELN